MSIADIKVGNRYRFADMRTITDVAIIFEKSSMDYSKGFPEGKVIYVGNDFAGKVDTNNIVLLKHHGSTIIDEDFEGEGE